MDKLNFNGKDIKLFSFDLWETIIREDDEDDRQLKRAQFLAQKLNMPVPETLAAINESGAIFTAAYRAEQRTMLNDERLNIILEKLGRTLSEKDFKEVTDYFSAVSVHIPPPLMDDIHDFIKAIKSLGIKTAMISDTGFTTGKDMRILLKMHGIFDYFDFVIFSDETGFAKPRKEVFQMVEKAFPDINKAEILHMGDNPRTDIAGSESMGWHTILFQRNEFVSKKHSTQRSDIIKVSSYRELMESVFQIKS